MKYLESFSNSFLINLKIGDCVEIDNRYGLSSRRYAKIVDIKKVLDVYYSQGGDLTTPLVYYCQFITGEIFRINRFRRKLTPEECEKFNLDLAVNKYNL